MLKTQSSRIFHFIIIIVILAAKVTCLFAMDTELRKKLLTMKELDQQARLSAINANFDYKTRTELSRVDEENIKTMKKIVADYGWPNEIIVGKDGANAAWLLVQHADQDPLFQKMCLILLKHAVEEKNASPSDYAYLYDRVAIAEKKLQLFGTQGSIINGKFLLAPLEDKVHVDERRAALGLCKLEDYIRDCEALYSKN